MMTMKCLLQHWDWPFGRKVHIHYILWLFPFKQCCEYCKTGCYGPKGVE